MHLCPFCYTIDTLSVPLPYKKEKGSLEIRTTPLGIMKNNLKYSALTTTTLLLVALAGPANATGPEPKDPPTVEIPVQPQTSVPVVAETTASLKFERPVVETTPAPVVVEPVKTQQAVAAPAPTRPSTPTPVAPVAAQTAPVAPVVGSGAGAALLASAYGQIGITQDCTRMVENALASIGIISGDLAPNQFFRFGSVVGTPAPGDIIISAGHVGIYAGNGQMISGGFNGNQTVLHPISYVGGYSAVRVG